MKIEVIRFYEPDTYHKNKSFVGTIHILLSDIGVNLKGINVYRKKNHWHFGIPARNAFDKVMGKEVYYQYISFEDRQIDKDIMDFLHSKGKEFIENYFVENPKISEKKESIQDKKSKVLLKEFVNPPPLKRTIARDKSKFAKK